MLQNGLSLNSNRLLSWIYNLYANYVQNGSEKPYNIKSYVKDGCRNKNNKNIYSETARRKEVPLLVRNYLLQLSSYIMSYKNGKPLFKMGLNNSHWSEK